LLITGSMVAGAFDLPPHLDLIKLPALSKHSDGRYTARVLPLSLAQTIQREQMPPGRRPLRADLPLVDKTPAGGGERRRRCAISRPGSARLVLACATSKTNRRPRWPNGSRPARRLHEEVTTRFCCTASAGLRTVQASDVVARQPCPRLPGGVRPRAPPRRCAAVAPAGPLVVVTVGGGGDVSRRQSLRRHAAAGPAPLARTALVTGPPMARA
jgi:hypothetical protein